MRWILLASFVTAVSLCAVRVHPLAASPRAGKAAVSAEQEVLDAEHRWVRTALNGDVKGFASLMADDYVAMANTHMTATDAPTTNKAVWVEALRSGQTKYKAVEIHDLQVHLYDDTAVVTGQFTQTATTQGRDEKSSGSYLDTWIKRNGRWLVISSAFFEIHPQESAQQ